MAYNTELEDRIDDLIADWPQINKKGMFGGIGYLINGNMCFGIHKDFLIVRMSRELSAEKLGEKNTGLFDITGRPMQGWVMVSEPGWKKKADLAAWLKIGREFALTLPAKKPGKRRKGR